MQMSFSSLAASGLLCRIPAVYDASRATSWRPLIFGTLTLLTIPITLQAEELHLVSNAKSKESNVDAGNGFGKVAIRELQLESKPNRSRLRLDTGELLPSFGNERPDAKSWEAGDGIQVELVRHGKGIGLAFYNAAAKLSKTPWKQMSPVRVWGFMGGSFHFFRGDKFATIPIELDNAPITIILDGGGKMEISKVGAHSTKVKLRYTFIERNGEAIVVHGKKLTRKKGLPKLKWGKPIEDIVAAHEIVTKGDQIQFGQKLAVRHFVKNLGKTPVSFLYYPRGFAFLSVVDESGNSLNGYNISRLGRAPRYQVILGPGEVWDFIHAGEKYGFDGGYHFAAVTKDGKHKPKGILNAMPHCQAGAVLFESSIQIRNVNRTGIKLGHHSVVTAATALVVKEPGKK